MNQFSESSPPPYKVLTPVFEGPLDLLLHLIEKDELDITKLALAQVTDQYLEYIKAYQEENAENISEFLVTAAKLLQIKSSVLLPRPSIAEAGEEDLGEELARQLLAYRRYKAVAHLLEVRIENNLRSYIRLSNTPRLERKADLTKWEIEDIRDIAYNILFSQGEKEPLTTVVAQPRVTIREKITQIIQKIKLHGNATFNQLIGEHSRKPNNRLHIVVSFLAMLELVKRRRVYAHQASLFDDILLHPAEEWDDKVDVMELEFGE